MVNRIKNMLKHVMPTVQNSLDAAKREPIGISPLGISVDSEVDAIKALLEKKFSRKFQMRVRVEGYLGGDVKYYLVVDDYCTDDPQREYHSVHGYQTSNILDVKKEFLKSYWNQVQRVHDSAGKCLDKWEHDIIEEYRQTMVASSREELLIYAELEGLKR